MLDSNLHTELTLKVRNDSFMSVFVTFHFFLSVLSIEKIFVPLGRLWLIQNSIFTATSTFVPCLFLLPQQVAVIIFLVNTPWFVTVLLLFVVYQENFISRRHAPCIFPRVWFFCMVNTLTYLTILCSSVAYREIFFGFFELVLSSG